METKEWCLKEEGCEEREMLSARVGLLFLVHLIFEREFPFLSHRNMTYCHNHSVKQNITKCQWYKRASVYCHCTCRKARDTGWLIWPNSALLCEFLFFFLKPMNIRKVFIWKWEGHECFKGLCHFMSANIWLTKASCMAEPNTERQWRLLHPCISQN